KMAFGVDGARQEIFAGEVDLAICSRQKPVAADSRDLTVEDRDAAFDGAAGRDDQAISKNKVCCFVRHKGILLSCLRQITQIDHAVHWRWHFLQAELFPVLGDSPRPL